MAHYKYPQTLESSSDTAFDGLHSPGQTPPYSGIYRCAGCGHEIVAEKSRSFPPQNHPQHAIFQGEIRWQLIVRTK